MQSLNQYYTEKKVSQRISHHIHLDLPPEWCLELCAGLGGLIQPLIEKWPHLKIATCDIDPSNYDHLQKIFPTGIHYLSDVTDNYFESIAAELQNKIDFSICNPPFCWQTNNKYSKQLLSLHLNKKYVNQKKIRSEIVFAIQNLRLLKPNAILVLVLPEFIIRGLRFREFREFLTRKYRVNKVIKLEENSFKGTETQTYALIIQKTERPQGEIDFVDVNDEITKITREAFVSGHAKQQDVSYFPHEILRGNWTGKKCEKSNLPTFHTTTFKNYPSRYVCLGNTNGMMIHPSVANKSGPIIAREGDILVARVGTRSLGKVAFIEKGQFIVSDCIFIVRISSFLEAKLYFDQNHEKISTRIHEIKKGTCAKYITKDDLKHIVLRNSEVAPMLLANNQNNR